MADTKADAKPENTGGGGGGSGSFSEQAFVEKLNKLNNTATRIQTLSNWCIFHRKRARKVVDTWEKQYNSANKDKKVSFLYLSNDILQNSKRKGGEFVNEFWRVLPGLLKDFYVNGGEDGKKVVGRLIGIWDERKVFGTRIEGLKDEILGGSTHAVGSNGNSSNPSSNPSSVSKAVRKDSGTTTKKLTVGGMPEKIVTAYQSVLDQHFDEDTALNKCNSAVSFLDRMDKDVDDACTQGIQQASPLISDLQGQEAVLKQCIEQLESVNMARITLINKLREALTEQEAKSELLRNQLHVARAKADHAMQLRQRLGVALNNGAGSCSSPLMVTLPPGQTTAMMQNSAAMPIFPQFQSLHPATSLPATSSAVGDEPKKTAAAMADKLASLSAPEKVLSSIFSSLAAEQARNGGSASGDLSAGPPGFESNKKPRVENPIHGSDMGASSYFGQVPQVQQQIGATPVLGGTQANQAPGSFPPPPPPLPLLPQFGQNTGGMFGIGPFGMVSGSAPPPPPLPNIMSAGFPRPSGLPPPPLLSQSQNQSQPQQQQSPQAPQQSPTSTGFFPPPGAGFFPPVQVQQSPSVQRQ
ncbi:actin cytoskeleton-regulatory complex protein pan1-like [Oryza brachyantha]|uniref:actin cytoskeleton-regulatory complex protein pan1-like n=1 Tax=Oryza brachyantha TaxID=4533 RepID=UPI001ADB62BB|nr:actin cytoskeleton-regulatory complex protein pan1-like [Oryza brachyantha]XP_040384801.1 actin cytoskeleton-regulatory complex protein pan1-like [Oryza brachyantha]